MAYRRYRIIFLWFVLIALIVTQGCQVQKEELLRVISPDNRVEATLVRENPPGGATVGINYIVYISPVGKKPTHYDIVFLAQQLEGESIEWHAPNILEIRYRNAKIKDFRNFWDTQEIDGLAIYSVEVREIRKDK